jgi:hypothetical protein
MEIADPPKHEPLRPHSNQRMFGIGGMPGGRGAGRGMPAGNTAAGNLAASLMQRLQQAQGGAAGPPQVPAAQVCFRLRVPVAQLCFRWQIRYALVLLKILFEGSEYIFLIQ